MCTAQSVPAGDDAYGPAPDPVRGSAFASMPQALRMASAALDYLNAAAGGDSGGAGVDGAGLGGAECGQVLLALGEIQAKLTAACAGFLRRFDAADAHDADGYGASSSWLAAKGGLSKKAAKAAVRQMRQLRDRPLLDEALAARNITDSLAFEIAGWTRKLPAEMREETTAFSSKLTPQGRPSMTWRPSPPARSRNGGSSSPTPTIPTTRSMTGSCRSARRSAAPGSSAAT